MIENVCLRCHDAKLALRFVTLTLRHQDVPLGQQIDRLLACFKLLRAPDNLGPKMLGGVWFLEVKLDAQGKLWHPHLHVIVEGDFIDRVELGKRWHGVTGDSFIVHIDQIDDVRKRASYVTKYSTKPLHAGVVKVPEKLDEFMKDLKGRRLYQCFGSWAKAQPKSPLPPRKLHYVDHVSTLHAAALRGDPEARALLHVLHGRYPALKRAFPLPHATPPPDDSCPF